MTVKFTEEEVEGGPFLLPVDYLSTTVSAHLEALIDERVEIQV